MDDEYRITYTYKDSSGWHNNGEIYIQEENEAFAVACALKADKESFSDVTLSKPELVRIPLP